MSWKELHIRDEAQSFRADVVTNESGDREYTGQCLDKNGKLLVFERAVSYSGDVDGMALEAFPDASAAAPYSFSLVCADGRKYKKAAAQAQYEALCGRLIDEMRREAKYQKTLAKQWNQPEYALFAAIRRGDLQTVQESEDAFVFLKAMIERGADPDLPAYDGRNALFEAVGGCSFAYSNTDEKTPELEAHIRRMIELLITAGADKTNASKVSKKTILETYRETPVWALIGGYF